MMNRYISAPVVIRMDLLTVPRVLIRRARSRPSFARVAGFLLCVRIDRAALRPGENCMQIIENGATDLDEGRPLPLMPQLSQPLLRESAADLGHDYVRLYVLGCWLLIPHPPCSFVTSRSAKSRLLRVRAAG